MSPNQRATRAVDLECTGTVEIARGQFAVDMREADTLAEGGYKEGARKRLALYSTALRAGDPIPSHLFDRLCGWLEEIANGADPAAVFGLKARRGAPPEIERLHKMERIAETIWHLNASGVALNDGASTDGAITLAADKHGADESTARRAWEVFGPGLRGLESSGEQGAPKLGPLKR